MKNILVTLVNYGENQLQYLEQVVNELKSFKKYNVYIVVNSNIPLDIKGIDLVNVIQLDNYQLLPLTCRQVIWNHKDDFDVFLFGENDHLFKEYHIDKHLEYSSFLPKDRITGLIQYEAYPQGNFYPAFHDKYDWDYDSVEIHSNKIFAHFSNLHQATFILTRDQLFEVGKLYDFTQFFKPSHYSVKCKVNTDIYQFCNKKKLICISDFSENIIKHLPSIVFERHKKNFNSDPNKMGKWDNWMIDKIDILKNAYK